MANIVAEFGLADDRLAGPLLRSATRDYAPVLWMVVASGVAFGLAAVALALKGTSSAGLIMALRVTARWSFLLFWFAYVGRAMSEVFGRAFAPIGGRGREFGLSYAAAQLIHLGLVVWLFQISSSPPLAGRLLEFFVIGIVWTYLLAVLSFGRLVEFLGARAWTVVRIVGMNYIMLAFAYDFVPAPYIEGRGRTAWGGSSSTRRLPLCAWSRRFSSC